MFWTLKNGIYFTRETGLFNIFTPASNSWKYKKKTCINNQSWNKFHIHHKPLDIYPLSILYLSSIYPLSILYLSSIYSLSILYLSSIYPLSILYLFSIYSLSILYLFSIYSLSILYLSSIYPLYILSPLVGPTDSIWAAGTS